MLMPDPSRTSAAYRRDLWLARQVIGQLRDQALESGDTFHVGDRALDAAALDALWDGLGRVDSHFWQEEGLEQVLRDPHTKDNRSAVGGGFGSVAVDCGQPGAGNRIYDQSRRKRKGCMNIDGVRWMVSFWHPGSD